MLLGLGLTAFLSAKLALAETEKAEGSHPPALQQPMPQPAPPSPAQPIAVEMPRPFQRGTVNMGLVLGLSTGQETAFTFGGSFGYFVLPGLEPGLQADVTFSSRQPTVTSLLPYLRWIIWRSYSVSPYLKAQGGRWFISDNKDLSAFGGGGGLVLFLSPLVGLQMEGLAFRLFPQDACPSNGCITTSIGLSLGFYLGGRP